MSSNNAALDWAFVEQQRKRLQVLRDELLGAEGRMLAGEREFQDAHRGEAEEAEDQAQREAEDEVRRARHDVDECRLRAALQKVEGDICGVSDTSGKPIPRPRLEAVPEAVRTEHEEPKQGVSAR